MIEAMRKLDTTASYDLLSNKEVVSDVSDGARAKLWVKDKSGNLYLYKVDKQHVNGEYTYEGLSEFLAMRIGGELQIPVVDIILGNHCILSKVMWEEPLHTFIELSDEMSHSFHMSNLTTFNVRTLLNQKTNPYYKETINMLLFDALIGNSDRHPGNFMYNENKGFYPLFDNGSSLLCYVRDSEIMAILKDHMRFKAICETKSKPVLRDEQKLMHKELVHILRNQYPDIFNYFSSSLACLDINSIFNGLEISDERRKLITKFLEYRIQWFRGDNNE